MNHEDWSGLLWLACLAVIIALVALMYAGASR